MHNITLVMTHGSLEVIHCYWIQWSTFLLAITLLFFWANPCRPYCKYILAIGETQRFLTLHNTTFIAITPESRLDKLSWNPIKLYFVRFNLRVTFMLTHRTWAGRLFFIDQMIRHWDIYRAGVSCHLGLLSLLVYRLTVCVLYLMTLFKC